jgi:hypothetical protein
MVVVAGRRSSPTRRPSPGRRSASPPPARDSKPEPCFYASGPIEPCFASLAEPVAVYSSALAEALGFEVERPSAEEEQIAKVRTALLDMNIAAAQQKPAESQQPLVADKQRKTSIDYSWVSPQPSPRGGSQDVTARAGRPRGQKALSAAATAAGRGRATSSAASSPRAMPPKAPGSPRNGTKAAKPAAPPVPLIRRSTLGVLERHFDLGPDSAASTPRLTPRGEASSRGLHMVSLLLPKYVSPTVSAQTTPRESSTSGSSTDHSTVG